MLYDGVKRVSDLAKSLFSRGLSSQDADESGLSCSRLAFRYTDEQTMASKIFHIFTGGLDDNGLSHHGANLYTGGEIYRDQNISCAIGGGLKFCSM